MIDSDIYVILKKKKSQKKFKVSLTKKYKKFKVSKENIRMSKKIKFRNLIFVVELYSDANSPSQAPTAYIVLMFIGFVFVM